MKEAESNVAIQVGDTPGGEAFEVSGRCELQMGVLIENMRREGFELSIFPPPRDLPRGGRPEEWSRSKEVTIDVDDEYSGAVIEKLTGVRKGRTQGNGPGRRGQDPHRWPLVPPPPPPLARADRLSRRFLTDTRGRACSTASSTAGRPTRARSRAAAGRADLHGERRGCGLCAVEPRGAGQHVHPRPGRGLARG